MKFSALTLAALVSTQSIAEELTPCNQNPRTMYFISNWKSASDSTDLLTSVALATGETSVTTGRIVSSKDINNDGNEDVIFKSYEDAGSSLETTFGVFIKCQGYYTFAGGDYYAEIEVSNEQKNNYNTIIAKSYKRDSQSQIIYKGQHAVLTSETLIFNPKKMKYTTSHEMP